MSSQGYDVKVKSKTCMEIMFNASVALFIAAGLVPMTHLTVWSFWPYLVVVATVTCVCVVNETRKIMQRKAKFSEEKAAEVDSTTQA